MFAYIHPQQLQVPDSLFSDLYTFEFDDYPLNDDQTVLASVRMFKDSGLASTFKIDDQVSLLLLHVQCTCICMYMYMYVATKYAKIKL